MGNSTEMDLRDGVWTGSRLNWFEFAQSGVLSN